MPGEIPKTADGVIGVAVGEGEGVGVCDPVGVADGLGVAVPVGVAVADPVGLGDANDTGSPLAPVATFIVTGVCDSTSGFKK